MAVGTVNIGAQTGWVNLINNSDMEGSDVSSFFSKTDRSDPYPSTITNGIGVNGSRGIMVQSTDRQSDSWDNQFWFRLNEPIPEGTKYRVTFAYRADENATIITQVHAEPTDYIYWDLFGELYFKSEWQTFTMEGEVTDEQSTDEKKFRSVAFDLNNDSHPNANKYYFDNIKFEVYKEPVASITLSNHSL
jgi:hypothetical protein